MSVSFVRMILLPQDRLQILHSCCLHSFSEYVSIKIRAFLITVCPENHIETFVLK